MELVFVSVDRSGRHAVHWRGLSDAVATLEELNSTRQTLLKDGEHIIQLQLWINEATDAQPCTINLTAERFFELPLSHQLAALRAHGSTWHDN